MHNDTPADLRSHVVEVALEAFQKHGIRQFTMDALAHELGMSKRTLYKLFSDKEELLMACIERREEWHRAKRQQLLKDTGNVLEFILGDLSYNLQHFHDQNLNFVADMARYPAVVAHVEACHEDHCAVAVEFLKRGVEQGVFRPDIDYIIYYNLIFRQMAMLATQPYFRSLSMRDIFLNVVVVYLRGCCTEKGSLMIDEFLKSREVSSLE